MNVQPLRTGARRGVGMLAVLNEIIGDPSNYRQEPWLFVLFILLVAWLLPKLWRAIRRAAHAVRRWFGGDDSDRPPHHHENLRERREDVLRELYGPDQATGRTEPPRGKSR